MDQHSEVVKAFLEKIKPHIVSNDKIVLDQVLHILKDYPYVPVDWTNLLLDRAYQNPDLRDKILINANSFPTNAESVRLLVRHADGIPKHRAHLLLSFVLNLNPELVLEFADELLERNLATEDFVRICEFLESGNKDEMQKEFSNILEALEKQEHYNHSLYQYAKMLVKKMALNGWYGKDEIKLALEKELQAEWFSFSGFLAVYAIGLLQLKEYIPVLAELLARDEDILLEEVHAALSAFQSDEVVQSVLPYAKNEDFYIFAVGVLRNTKTVSAIDAMVECYNALDNGEAKSLCVEGVCSHLSERALPLIDDYSQQNYYTHMFDIDEIYYAYYKMMGIDHPSLEEWTKSIEEREEKQKKIRARSFVTQKIGRNDPCPCGSGKKYKKCCGR